MRGDPSIRVWAVYNSLVGVTGLGIMQGSLYAGLNKRTYGESHMFALMSGLHRLIYLFSN